MFPVNKPERSFSRQHLCSPRIDATKVHPKKLIRVIICMSPCGIFVPKWHSLAKIAKLFAFRWLALLSSKLVARDALQAYLESITVELRRCQALDKRAMLLVVWLAMRPPRALPAPALQRHQLPPLLQ